MLVAGLLKIVALLLFTSIGSLVSGSRIPEKSSKGLESTNIFQTILRNLKKLKISSHKPKGKLTQSKLEELTKSISSLEWVIRLVQQKVLLYSKLWPEYNRALAKLDTFKARRNTQKRIAKAIDRLFHHVMKSKSLADQIRVLRAMDPFLNNGTVKYLINNSYDKLKDFSSAIDFLIVDGTKTIDKDPDSARAFLSTNYERSLINSVTTIDSSIWFFINQREFFFDPLLGFKQRTLFLKGIIGHRIILRADVDFEFLFRSMKKSYKSYGNDDFVSKWYHYLVKISPFEGAQLYNTLKNDWKSVGKALLLLEDPKSVANLLDTTLLLRTEDNRNYLLLLQENPTKRLIKLGPTKLDELYCCFALNLNIGEFSSSIAIFHKISKEKHVELASHFAGLQEKHLLSFKSAGLQQRLPYLEFVSLIENNLGSLNAGYARKFAQNPKTFELLDIIKTTLIRGKKFDGKYFDKYLIENLNWEKAVERHFHYYISSIILANCQVLAKALTEYFGINIELDNQEIILAIRACKSDCVNCTLDKIARNLSKFFEILERPIWRETSKNERLEIAIQGSIFNEKAFGIAYKEDFVYYKSKKILYSSQPAECPIFVDLARIYYKDMACEMSVLKKFLRFEHLVYIYFPNLTRMDLKQGLRKISAKDSFSRAIKNFITENFEWFKLPRILRNLETLEREMFKYSIEIAIWLQLKKIPIKTLLKTIYETLNEPGSDLEFAFVRRLLNAQLSHAGSV